MKLAIDLTPLQGPHRKRGIGATLINFMNHLPASKDLELVLYFEKPNETVNDPLELLELAEISYTVVHGPAPGGSQAPTTPQRKLKRLLLLPFKACRQIWSLGRFHRGDDRLRHIGSVDAFLQFDQQQTLPHGKIHKALVVYDLIPYLLEADYLKGYRTARKHGHSRKGALNHALHRWLYLHNLKVNVRKADSLIAISEQTKRDFIRLAKAPVEKIVVVELGISPAPAAKPEAPVLTHFIETSWGYMERPYERESVGKFLLFVGGVDHRRKIDELVTAYNHLRAAGHNIKLVLAGDILQGPKNIPIAATRRALERSSYSEGIIFTGFVSQPAREWLYEHALAFVWPSRYEGFGLPVLEAMRYGTPVITYKNSSIPEVAKDAVLYADGATDIFAHAEMLLAKPELAKAYVKKSIVQASKFSWPKTSKGILSVLKKRV